MVGLMQGQLEDRLEDQRPLPQHPAIGLYTLRRHRLVSRPPALSRVWELANNGSGNRCLTNKQLH